MRSSTVLLLCLLSIVAVHAACINTVNYTAWSSVTAWNQANANINIASGQNVILDRSPAVSVGVITVQGTLFFKNTNLELKTAGIVVASGGSLILGTLSCPLTAKVIVTLVGNSSLGSDPTIVTPGEPAVRFGNKGIAVSIGGSIQMNGFTSGPLWTRISTTAMNGSSTLRLEQAVDWVPGDSIVISSTDFSEVLDVNNKTFTSMNGIPFPEQSESRVISTVSSDKKTLTLKVPLVYMHWGQGYERAEVGLLTRNVVIRGDNSSDSNLFGGHLLMRKGPISQIAGVEFTKMGQQKIMGRYPVHFHWMNDAYDVDASIVNSSIHDNYQRCISVHESNGVIIKNNVAYKTYGHCYFLEDGGEVNNTFDGNLGIYTKPMFPPLIPSDIFPSVFWISHTQNTFVNNAASSTFVAYWVALPAKPTGELGRYLWANVSSMKPRASAFIKFDNNVAHSCYEDGWQMEKVVNADDTLTVNAGWVEFDTPNVISNLLSYKCRRSAAWSLFTPMGSFVNCTFLDSSEQLLIGTESLPVINCTFVGESDNYGLITQPAYGRSNPRADGLFHYVGGYRGYDNGGTQILINCTFLNFTSRPERKMGALVNSNTGQFGTYPDNLLYNNVFINAVPMLAATNLTLQYQRTRANGLCYVDATGDAIPGGGYLAGNQTFYKTMPGCTYMPNSNGYLCKPFHGRMVSQQMLLAPYGKTTTNPVVNADTTIYREDADFTSYNGVSAAIRYRAMGSSPTSPYFMSPGKTPIPSLGYYSVLPTNESGRRLALGPYLDVYIADQRRGDWNVLAFPFPAGTQFNISYGGTLMTMASRWEDLAAFSPYYNASNQHLYLLLAHDVLTYWSSPFKNYTNQGYYSQMFGSGYIQVRSSCGNNCGVGDSYVVPPMPTTIPTALQYNKYISVLESCKASAGQSGKAGKLYVQLYPSSFLVGPTIGLQLWHNVYGSSSDLYMSFEDARTGLRLSDNTFGHSYMTFMFKISRDFWQAALSGNVRVSVRRMSDDAQVLTGILTLDESRTAKIYYPPAVAATSSSCTPSYDTLTVFDDQFSSTNFAAAKGQVTAGGVCGNASLSISSTSIAFSPKGDLVLASKYKSIEFWVKSRVPYNNYNFFNVSISVTNSRGTFKAPLEKLNTNYIINSLNWTFVRVNLADLGGNNITSMTLVFWPWFSETPMLIDNLRFSTKDASVSPYNGNANVTPTFAAQLQCASSTTSSTTASATRSSVTSRSTTASTTARLAALPRDDPTTSSTTTVAGSSAMLNGNNGQVQDNLVSGSSTLNIEYLLIVAVLIYTIMV